MSHFLYRQGWIAIAVLCIVALLIQQSADGGEPLVVGLPLWVLFFILLQVVLTITAAWIARP